MTKSVKNNVARTENEYFYLKQRLYEQQGEIIRNREIRNGN